MDIKSEIAGKVWKIEAPAGTAVEEDDPVIILESMKMEIPVEAPANGKIIQVLVEEDELVSEGQVVATMET
ncbi:acetyl-CoA carboxylase biotin carboxyl carrier protein subunit [Pyruvatibacter sp.]|uniref:acetyl-CoA carboxylase biotin carboxyl carrier protein subunit n=1 Tax=Pyruvatibacter sp. TaxID=1981328 RepID=UPI0032ED3423